MPWIKIKRAIFVIILAINCCGERGDKSPQSRAPNFVFILTDDLGYGDLGCYGSETIATPRIDGLAKEGIRFTQHYVSAPICTPTRASFLTGNYANRVGLSTPLHVPDERGLPPELVILPEALKAAGYHCGLIGKWHLGHTPEHYPTRHGFDTYWGTPLGHMFDRETPVDNASDLFLDDEKQISFPPHADLTERITEQALAYIQSHRDEPFFLFVSHPMPHVPLAVSERFAGKSKAGLYGDVIECLDWSVGQVVDRVEQLGLSGRTYIIFTSDNGPLTKAGGSAGGLRGEKHDPYEGGVRVPCIVRGPGIPVAAVCDQVTTIMDWYPSFVRLAGGVIPVGVKDGRDISALLGDPASPSPHEQFYYIVRDGVFAGIRVGDWKLLIRSRRKSVVELYNLAVDPGEQDNRHAAEAVRVETMVQKLQAFERSLEP